MKREKTDFRNGFLDDRNFKVAMQELLTHFQSNAELFFERELKEYLIDKTIYSEESLEFLDKLIRRTANGEFEEKKILYVILMGAYLGQFVISKFDGNWVYDPNNWETPLDCLIRYNKDSALFFNPFASIINRIDYGKKVPLRAEINIIKKKIKDSNATTKCLKKAFGNDYEKVISEGTKILEKVVDASHNEDFIKVVDEAAKAFVKNFKDADKRRR